MSAPLQQLEVEKITGMAINRSVVGAGSSRRCTRRIGAGSPAHHVNGRWISSFRDNMFCSTGLAFRTSTAKPTTYTTRFALELHTGSFVIERVLEPGYGCVPRAD